MSTFKELLEKIEGVQVEEGKPYSTKIYKITDEPNTETGRDIYELILEHCQTDGGATVEERGDCTLIRFYYKGDWRSVESKLMRDMDIDEEDLEYETSEKAERKKWNETGEERDRREAEETERYLRKWGKKHAAK